MDPIDRRPSSPSSVNMPASNGQRESTRERAQDPIDFRAWLEKGPDAALAPDAESVIAAAPSDSVVVAMAGRAHVVDVVYPWALQSNAYLSQLGGHSNGATGQTTEDAIATRPVFFTRTDAGLPAFQVAASPRTARHDGQLPLTPGAAAAMRGVQGSPKGSDATPADAAGTALVASWSERLLRRTVDADGNTTWWLRDYRMEAAEQEALTRSLTFLPPQQRPHRIVINGVEVWRAPHPLPEP